MLKARIKINIPGDILTTTKLKQLKQSESNKSNLRKLLLFLQKKNVI